MNGVITIYKNNGEPLLRRRRQRAPLRGEDLADDRVEAVAVLNEFKKRVQFNFFW